MYKISLVVPKYLQNNIIFKENFHRDNIYDRFIKLKKEFKKHNYDLATNDIYSLDEADIILYASNMPKYLPKKSHIKKSYLILTESAFIRPDNYDKHKHKYFHKIFTWSDELVDNIKYFKLNYANLFPIFIDKDITKKEKLCILISAHKNPPHTKNNDLYSQRKKAIKWFEKHHLDDFDLYGIGWDTYHFTGNKILRYMNLFPFFGKTYAKLINQNFTSYRGSVANKKDMMEKYKFSICYENVKDIPGYITEKIFDSLVSGCVPIYWGANNILEYVPKSCFVDKRDYDTYDDLYHYLINISDNEYRQYLDNIEKYLKSELAFQFKSEGFVKTIVDTIIVDII